MKLRESYTCPLELVHDIVKGKWKTIIIFQLRNGKCSFSKLHHSITGITQKMLLEQLHELMQIICLSIRVKQNKGTFLICVVFCVTVTHEEEYLTEE